MPRADHPLVHVFPSTGEAYDASQTRLDVWDGDVLAVPSEGVFGFLLQAWPIAVVTSAAGAGAFHGFRSSGRDSIAAVLDAEGYAASFARAIETAEIHATV